MLTFMNSKLTNTTGKDKQYIYIYIYMNKKTHKIYYLSMWQSFWNKHNHKASNNSNSNNSNKHIDKVQSSRINIVVINTLTKLLKRREIFVILINFVFFYSIYIWVHTFKVGISYIYICLGYFIRFTFLENVVLLVFASHLS